MINLDSTLTKQGVPAVSNVQQPSMPVVGRCTHRKPSAASVFAKPGLVQHGELVGFQFLLTLTYDLGTLHFHSNWCLRSLHNSLESDAFCDLVPLLKETITEKEPPALPSSVQLTVAQSGYV